MMDLTGDFFVGGRVPDSSLDEALARATGLDVADVRSIRAPRESEDENRLFVITIRVDAPGDYPSQYIVNADDRIVQRFTPVLATLAQELRVPILSGAGLDDPDIMNLALPDGTTHQVFAEQDEGDGGIRNTPEMRRLIAQHQPSPSRVRTA